MSQAVNYSSFPLSAGQDVSLNLTIVDSAGAAFDLTGASLRFIMATALDRNVVIDTATSPQTASYTVTDATAGEVTVSITDTNTDALLGDYYYEVKITDSSSTEGVTNRGIITFEASTT